MCVVTGGKNSNFDDKNAGKSTGKTRTQTASRNQERTCPAKVQYAKLVRISYLVFIAHFM